MEFLFKLILWLAAIPFAIVGFVVLVSIMGYLLMALVGLVVVLTEKSK